MTTIDEMDEYVDWDKAAGPAGGGMGQQPPGIDENIDLTFGNIDGDDFSFWALQHFETNFPDANALPVSSADPQTLTGTVSPAKELWETPDAPCEQCKSGNFQCKRIQEGSYKGYCTSCVARRCGCSFATNINSLSNIYEGGAAFPPNPWPIVGDHPNAIHNYEDVQESAQSTSLPDMTASAGQDVSETSKPVAAAKIGGRFSRESVKILKNWLSTHARHPYPTEDEKEALGRQTGLNKTQITNWLANARRRGKIKPPRSTSPHVGSNTWSLGGASGAIDIPWRRGTPALDQMNPLQRWVDSPPEHEPASVTAIARAVTASSTTLSSGLNSPYSFNNTDDGSGRSLCNASSVSSLNTSISNRSSQSAYSHQSKGSFGSFGSSFNRGRRRRRRRATPKRPEESVPGLTVPVKTFQCTFCTETFRTKHDWQRHEKSLHLSLERWVCAPDGPRVVNPENGQLSCVFCGEANPSDAHVESHNYSACQERSLEERTFYRKDHLRQHLKLVHDVTFVQWAMEPWKVATPEIRSRCGFCGIIMDTWSTRVDHLAEHYKTGADMSQWKGGWGFEPPILELVENSIPPYLIHDERNSPLPFVASQPSPETPRNAYDLIKYELAYWLSHEMEDKGRMPTDQEMQYEACRIVFGSEVSSSRGISSAPSWLRDLIMADEQITMGARLSPIRGPAENRMSVLRINGKDNIFEDDPFELELREYVKARQMLGLTAMDGELQVEACRIIGRMEEMSNKPFEMVANWLIRLIYASTSWLASFRRRCSLPRSEDIADGSLRSKDVNKIDSTVHNYSRLESELADFVKTQRSMGIVPTDSDIQRQARIIIYEYDDDWNQTAADNPQWLAAFKQRHCVESPASSSLDLLTTQPLTIESAGSGKSKAVTRPMSAASQSRGVSQAWNQMQTNLVKTGPFFLNDANCYRRLARELHRWVASTMSPNNPNRHVPSDDELQHQARWILYDDDDPWNQTAADNAEWLQRFKRDCGILKDGGPGLPETEAWAIKLGGSGFAPPYAFPRAQMQLFNTGSAAAATTSTAKSSGLGSSAEQQQTAAWTQKSKVQVPVREGPVCFPAPLDTANKFLESFTQRYPAPATVFCSRELESGLIDFVERRMAQGIFPDDDSLRSKAREIVGTETTAADDVVLLEKFKEMMRARLLAPTATALSGTVEDASMKDAEQPSAQKALALPLNMDLNPSDNDLDDILKDMQFQFDDDLAAF